MWDFVCRGGRTLGYVCHKCHSTSRLQQEHASGYESCTVGHFSQRRSTCPSTSRKQHNACNALDGVTSVTSSRTSQWNFITEVFRLLNVLTKDRYVCAQWRARSEMGHEEKAGLVCGGIKLQTDKIASWFGLLSVLNVWQNKTAWNKQRPLITYNFKMPKLKRYTDLRGTCSSNIDDDTVCWWFIDALYYNLFPP